MPSPAGLEELRAEVRYARERLDLYRARAYGQRATSARRMRELERACASAEARLLRAEAQRDQDHERAGA
jgi:hypothetical protein